MKKIAIVLFVAATALAGCGKKKAPEAPATPAGDQGSAAAPAEGSAAPAEGSAAAPDAPPAEGGGGGGM